MTITIATKNNSKFESISELIKQIAPIKSEIRVVQISDSTPTCLETGSTAQENAIIKSAFYEQFISTPYIVADDEVIFTNSKTSFGHLFHGLGKALDLDGKDILVFLQNLLESEKSIAMKRIRYIMLADKTQKLLIASSFKSVLRPLSEKKFKALLKKNVIENPLNYYIIPSLYDKSLSEYSSTDRSKIVYDLETRKKIINFLFMSES